MYLKTRKNKRIYLFIQKMKCFFNTKYVSSICSVSHLPVNSMLVDPTNQFTHNEMGLSLRTPRSMKCLSKLTTKWPIPRRRTRAASPPARPPQQQQPPWSCPQLQQASRRGGYWSATSKPSTEERAVPAKYSCRSTKRT